MTGNFKIPLGEDATTARYMDTTTRRRVTIIPVLSPLLYGTTKLIHEMRTNMAEGR